MRTLWIWYRAFERNGAATSGWPKVEIDLEVTFGLCNQMTVSQRMLPYNLLNAMPRSSHSRLAVFIVINLQPSERDALAIAHYSPRRCLRDSLSRNAEIHAVIVARIHRQPPLVPLLRRMIVLSR